MEIALRNVAYPIELVTLGGGCKLCYGGAVANSLAWPKKS